MAVRLAHFSDIHLTARSLGWTARDFLGKRTTGWMNVKLLGRGRRFRHAPAVADVLLGELKTRGYDGLLFSGDATALAFESEFRIAAAALGVGDPALPPAVAVPGNHDYYTAVARRDRRFERAFAPWQEGERVDGETYPFARKFGPVWAVCVNSSTPNRWIWDASGAVGPAQLDRLRRLCERLGPGPRVLVTHYPLRGADGRVERRTHRLRDHISTLAAAKECGVALWVHGHIHRAYILPPSDAIPFPVVCAGSGTQTHRWGYNEYTLADGQVTVVRRAFDRTRAVFVEQPPVVLPLG